MGTFVVIFNIIAFLIEMNRCLFIKTWTIYRVWSKAKDYQKTNLTPFYIMRLVVGALLIEVVSFLWILIENFESALMKMKDIFNYLDSCGANESTMGGSSK